MRSSRPFLFERELKVVTVLVSQCRDRHDHIGDIYALVVRDGAADPHFSHDLPLVGLQHVEANLAVVDQDVGSRLNRLEQLRMGQLDLPAVAGLCPVGRR